MGHEETRETDSTSGRVTKKTQYELAVLDLVCEFKQICTSCGRCCSGFTIPLFPTELPIIVKQLQHDEARRCIRKNPYPFNIQSEFCFTSDGPCPFLEQNLCRIYPVRPTVCRLFPVRVEAFVDGTQRYLREPLCNIVLGEWHHPCTNNNMLFFHRTHSLATEFGSAGPSIIDYMLATVLSKPAFAFLYGQEPQKGSDRYVLSEVLMASKKQEDFNRAFLGALVNKYRNPSLWNVELRDRLQTVDNDLLTQICSHRSLISASNLTFQCMERIQKHRQSLALWREHIGAC